MQSTRAPLQTERPSSGTSSSPCGLELRGVVKRYGAFEAVRGIDLRVPKGEFLTVLGPSGSGKTTLLRMISGFTDITDGQILLAGRDVSNMTPAQRDIGMVFQNYALFPHMTALQNVAYGLKMRGVSKDKRLSRAREVLGLVGLTGMEDRLPRELSGGQQQRVALGRALAFGPDLLLMDEPLGALDRELRIRMAAELRRIHAEFSATVVYVTHDREEALTLSDRIAIMRNGEVEACDTPEVLFTRPNSSFVGSFFGGHNVVPATRDGVPQEADTPTAVTVESLGHRVTVCAGAGVAGGDDPVSLIVPSHAFSLRQKTRDYVDVQVSVQEAVYMGEVTRIQCTAVGAGPSPVKLTAALAGHLSTGITNGSEVTVYVDMARCSVARTTPDFEGVAA